MEISKYIVESSLSVRAALGMMDRLGKGFVAVYENGKIAGILTDGDFRRAILSGHSLEGSVKEIANKRFISVEAGPVAKERARHILRTKNVRHVPIIKDGELMDIIFHDELVKGDTGSIRSEYFRSVPVVIMAGGRGTRLDPFTKVLPKPLIPIHDKPIIEHIIDRFTDFGANDFYLSINHKAKMIKSYFEEIDRPYTVNFVEEDAPLGTAGSLFYLRDRIRTDCVVTNCDVMIKADYFEMMQHHLTSKHHITMVVSCKHHVIPYGICSIKEGGILNEMQEKPEYSLLVNTGMYVLKPEVLQLLPDKTFFSFPELIKLAQSKAFQVGVFPISEENWIDVGHWEEYHKAVKYFQSE